MPRPCAREEASLQAARAALLVSALLLLFALPAPPERARPCEHPVEAEAEQGASVRVACGRSPESGAPLRGPARLLFGQRLDLNRASAASLEALPAIGPARAAAIVASREHRPFASLDDLLRVPGIGPRTLAGLAGWAEVESPALSAD